MTIIDYLRKIKEAIPPHLYAPVIFLLVVVFLWGIKGFLVSRLRKWAAKTNYKWDDIIVNAVSFPLNLLILASGLAVFMNVLPFPEKIEKIATITFQSTIILAAVIFVNRLIQGVFDEYYAGTVFSKVSKGLVQGILRGFVIIIGVLIFLDLIGISITPILASLGIGSLAVALALQDTLANFFAGLYVLVDKPVQIGDFVKLESGEEGYVIDVGWRNTRVRTLANNVVVVPNTKLSSSVITNYYLPEREAVVTIELGVHYNSDLDQVEKVALETAHETLKTIPGAVKNSEPVIRFLNFGDSAINLAIVLRVHEFSEGPTIKHSFIKKLHERFKKENIIIPYPIRTIELTKETLSSLK